MFDRPKTKELEEKAWKILSDPCSDEKKWSAACKVVEGKQYSVSSTMPKPLGLIVSSIISLASAFGGSLVFLVLFVCLTGLFEMCGLFMPHFLGEGFSWSLPFLFSYLFGSIFTYQKAKWQGGRFWDITKWSVFGIFIGVPILLIAAISTSGADTALYVPLLLFIACSWSGLKLGSAVSNLSCENLSKTIGASKIFEYTKYGMMAGLLLLPMNAIAVFMLQYGLAGLFYFFASIGAIIGGTSYLATRKNKCLNKNTSFQLAQAIWHPILLACLFAAGAGALSSIVNGDLFSTSIFVSTVYFLGTIGLTIASTYLFAFTGAHFGTEKNKLDLSSRSLLQIPGGLNQTKPTSRLSQATSFKEETA